MKWKLVPVEPDANQIYAMRTAFSKVRRGGIGGQTMDACYQRENAPELSAYSAMLEAAPPPPKLSDERIAELIEEYQPGCKHSFTIGFARAIEREILGE